MTMWWADTHTGNTGTGASYVFPQNCTACSVKLVGTIGSNQHERREQGKCVHCGKLFVRTINWRIRNTKPWREA